MLKKTLLPVLVLFVSFSLFAQNHDKYIEQQDVVPYQKIYLHTDRDFYFYGDTLWFASYLVNGQTHILSLGKCNLYVELIDTSGIIFQKDIFPIDNGTSQGYFSFTDESFKEGTYLLRAYTDYLKNFGDDSFYKKTIKLSDTKNSAGLTNTTNLSSDSSKIDIQFFPEGGFLLANQANLVAFKAINDKGKALDINGRITDSKDQLICLFSGTYKGMGKFYFTPSQNSKYNIEIEEYPELDLKLPEIWITGSKITVTEARIEYVGFKIITSVEDQEKSFFIVNIHRGIETFFLECKASQINKNIKVKTGSFKDGINRVILLNSKLEPLSERLIFLNPESDFNLDLMLNQTQFKTREKVTVQINTNLYITQENANLSIAVVNENALNAEGNIQNIKSYLLIDSELSGSIPSPADFFINNKTISSQTKLDYLMLTNGWKNYIWTNLKKEDIPIEFEPQIGVSFQGKVLHPLNKKPFKNSKVILSVKSDKSADPYSTISDEKGNFEFKDIQFTGNTSIFLQGKDHKDRTKTYLELDSFSYNAPINIEKTKLLNYFSDIPLSFYRLNYFNNRALREFYPTYNTKVLEQIEVKAKKPEEPDGHNRVYGKASASKKVTESYFAYENVFEYLKGRFAGVSVRMSVGAFTEYSVHIRGANSINVPSKAMILVDGMQADTKDIKHIPMSQIDKVEVLKGPDAAIYGVRGANGVVSILTKKFENIDPNSIIVPGTIVKQIKGFAPFREFYSPKYTLKNIESDAPDVRTTLYWNPNVSVVNGKAKISFFTCDNIARYRIFVEGVSESGKIYLGGGEFEISSTYY